MTFAAAAVLCVGCSGSSKPDARTPPNRYANSDLTVKYLDQNWTPAESLEFYHLRQGSLLMTRVLFDALEQPDSQDLFRQPDHLAGFGFLKQTVHERNPNGYPVGFVGEQALELNCSACHTSRITFDGVEYRIDGGQAMADIERFQIELVRSLQLTLADAPTDEQFEMMAPDDWIDFDPTSRFGRFAQRVLGLDRARAGQVLALRNVLKGDFERRQRYNDANGYRDVMVAGQPGPGTPVETWTAYGFGRIDALGAILNQATAEAIDMPMNAQVADAPVNYPAIWDAPQHNHVQWNGAVENDRFLGPLARNAAQVVGVFGIVHAREVAFGGYDSSVNFTSLRRAESLVTKLWSPQWPDAFPRNEDLARRGEPIYQTHCVDCHQVIQRDDPQRKGNEQLIPINISWRGYPVLATDDMTAKRWSRRQAQVGPLAGRFETNVLGDRFPEDGDAMVPSRSILAHVVFNVITRSFVPWRDELVLSEGDTELMSAPVSPDHDEWMRYKARPLNGIWSSPPYLHNGSVRTIADLLKAPSERPSSFHVGTTEYDPRSIGFVDAGEFIFDTTKDGNRNTGHVYGTDLPAADKQAVVEFLKTL